MDENKQYYAMSFGENKLTIGTKVYTKDGACGVIVNHENIFELYHIIESISGNFMCGDLVNEKYPITCVFDYSWIIKKG